VKSLHEIAIVLIVGTDAMIAGRRFLCVAIAVVGIDNRLFLAVSFLCMHVIPNFAR